MEVAGVPASAATVRLAGILLVVARRAQPRVGTRPPFATRHHLGYHVEQSEQHLDTMTPEPPRRKHGR